MCGKRKKDREEDYGWLREIVQEHVKAVSEKRARRKVKRPASGDDRPTFDASSWKPTPKALEMLGESPRAIAEEEAKRRAAKAAENEDRYGESAPTYADRIMERMSNTRGKNYFEIEALAGRNGKCHSRKTTYRRYKFGKGSVSRKGYLESGFEENKK